MLKKLTPEQQAEILQTGIREFSKLGLDKANVNVIAKEAGVSIGVLYKYYEDKNSFFFACVRHALESLDEVLTAKIDARRDPEENAEILIRAAVDFSREHPETVILYHRITCFEDGEFAEQLVREIEGKTAETYRDIISAYQEPERGRADPRHGMQ